MGGCSCTCLGDFPESGCHTGDGGSAVAGDVVQSTGVSTFFGAKVSEARPNKTTFSMDIERVGTCRLLRL